MYRGNYNKSSMNYFFEFVSNHFEDLFYIIYPLIEDRIDELLEQKLEIYIRNFDFQSKLNEALNIH